MSIIVKNQKYILIKEYEILYQRAINIWKENKIIIFHPPNKYWKKIALSLCGKAPGNFDLFYNTKENLWKIKHFQMYENLFSVLKYYDELWMLGPLVRPEIFFSELEYFYFREDITVIYPSLNKREVLNGYIENFIKDNSIISIPYSNFLKYLFQRKTSLEEELNAKGQEPIRKSSIQTVQ